MKNIGLVIGIAMLVSAACAGQQAEKSDSIEQQAKTVSFCDLAANPSAYNKSRLRMTGFVTYGFEDFGFTDPECPVNSGHFQIWVMYGGTAQSGAIYCCPGEGGGDERNRVIKVEGISIPLTRDERFEQFSEFLKQQRDTTAHVTLEGRFFSGTKQNYGGPTFWGGYGHMGCCSLLVVERIVNFDRHDTTGLDTSADAGWYVYDGCKYSSLQYKEHLSLNFDNDVARHAIEAQRRADAGNVHGHSRIQSALRWKSWRKATQEKSPSYESCHRRLQGLFIVGSGGPSPLSPW